MHKRSIAWILVVVLLAAAVIAAAVLLWDRGNPDDGTLQPSGQEQAQQSEQQKKEDPAPTPSQDTAGETAAWVSAAVSFSYPTSLCSVALLDGSAASFRLAVTPVSGGTLPRIDVQSLTSDEVLSTPSETEFVQFAQAVLERYFTGGLRSDAFAAETPALDGDRWSVAVRITTPDAGDLTAQVMLLPGETGALLAVCLMDEAEAQAMEWLAVYQSIAVAE